MKTATVWIEDANSSSVPATRNFFSEEKRNAIAQELVWERGGHLDLTKALQTFSLRLTDCPSLLLHYLLFTSRPGDGSLFD